MYPDSITHFKNFCLIAFLISIAFIGGLQIYKYHLILIYDFGHLYGIGIESLFAIFGGIVIVIPLAGIPYWSALIIIRWKSKFAKYFLYLYDVCMVFAGLSYLYKYIYDVRLKNY